jgi:hypothetical protein
LSSTGPRTFALLAAVSLLILALFAGPASAQKLKQPTAAKALRTLVRQTNALPGAAASKAQKSKLVQAARSARRTVRTRPCASVRQLARYRRVLRGIKVKKGRRYRRASNRLTALAPASMTASRALLAKRSTRRCGGGVKPSKREQAKMTLLQNDTNGMRVRVQLPALRFVDEEGGGRTWTKLVLPNTDAPGRAGTPGIPMVSSTIGVPDGATLDVDATRTTSYTIGAVDVFPNQREPVDQGGPELVTQPPDFQAPPFATRPFAFDGDAYRRRGNVPAKPANGVILGQSRDLTLGNLRVPAAQYNPRKKTLKVLNSVDVTVRFEGGSHSFSDQLASPWEYPQRRLVAALLNSDAVRGDLPTILERCGEEMLVITNPSTLAAANQFANARRSAGLRTNVFQTGGLVGQIGTTAGEIQTFIRSRLTAFGCIRPSYVTLMGDDELVPTFPGINGIESDLEYSMRDNADELPDVAVGRIVGDNAAAVTTAVTKIINYENSPPGGSWLRRATIAAQFQDDDLDGRENRTFTRFAEVTRNGILNTPGSFGLSVDRIYEDNPTATPLKFDDGTDLPNAIKKPGFAWDGDTADVTAAWNEGRFLIAHRDHGWNDGWGDPFFTTANVDALTNGNLLPVVLSINCSSGAFQRDDTAFATNALVNPNGGAVGVFGDTEDSPSWHNTQIAWGFVDGLLPRILGGEGPANKQRVGDALINGKTRLAGLAPPSGPGITGGDGNTRNELYLWHYFGDPSMQMWGGDPIKLPDTTLFEAEIREVYQGPPRPDPPPYTVFVTLPGEFNGQPISLVREGQVIGKAIVVNGQADIPANFGDGEPTQGELQVAMEADGAVPVSVPVEGVPVETRMTRTCPPSPFPSETPMTTSGKLEPGFAGAKIVVRYTPPSGTGQPFERTVTTDANGNWSDSVVPSDDDAGGKRPMRGAGQWTIEPRYDGDSGHRASKAQACTVTVFDNS